MAVDVQIHVSIAIPTVLPRVLSPGFGKYISKFSVSHFHWKLLGSSGFWPFSLRPALLCSTDRPNFSSLNWWGSGPKFCLLCSGAACQYSHGLDGRGSIPDRGRVLFYTRVPIGCRTHLSFCPMDSGGDFNIGKAAGAWSWPRLLELYLHCPTSLHGIEF
jgi:hypothetical protein